MLLVLIAFKFGNLDIKTAAYPATNGAAKDVPCITPK
jgi:hypothetical protein